MSSGRWYQKKYHLDRMNSKELIRAYFTYPGIQVYFILLFFTVTGGICLHYQELAPWSSLGWTVLATLLAYPFVEYGVHRFILHGRYLYRSPWTAALWKRIHFDHHQDPNDLGVLFGALHTTLPTIVVSTVPIGILVGGWQEIPIAFATGLGAFMVYELCHCMQHLKVTPRHHFLRKIKRHHLLHHFHNEQGNFGITSVWCDRIFGTYYKGSDEVPFSKTVSNLGYADQECFRYPWVAELSQQKS